MDRERAKQIVADYEALVGRAVNVAADVPYYSDVNEADNPHITFDGDNVVLSWKEYQSDYYGGGYLRDEENRFPIDALLMNDTELAAFRAKVKREKAERQEKVKAAREAVEHERREAHDRAEFARLSTKYGKST